MLNCKQTSKLVSQSLDRPLTFSDRLKIRFHLLMCAACKRFNAQIQLLATAVKMLTHETENDDSIALPLDAKARIGKEIARASESKLH